MEEREPFTLTQKVIIGFQIIAFAFITALVTATGYSYYTKIVAEKLAAKQVEADEMSGVVAYCNDSGWRCVGSAVMISDNWAITAKHMVRGSRNSFLTSASGESILIDLIVHPEGKIWSFSEDHPLLIHISTGFTEIDQPNAIIGEPSSLAKMFGKTRNQIFTSDYVHDRGANLMLTEDMSPSKNFLYLTTINQHQDTVCHGDSGGGIFNGSGELFALVSRVEEAGNIYQYHTDEGYTICFNDTIGVIDLAPYRSWIEETIQQ